MFLFMNTRHINYARTHCYTKERVNEYYLHERTIKLVYSLAVKDSL